MKDTIGEIIQETAECSISAAMFLSRLPLKIIADRLAINGDDPDFSVTPRYFAIAAFIVALPAALVMWIASIAGLSPFVAAILTIITHTIVTGALHEDALADVADGFGGGRSQDDKLDIMRDSQIGTYGASILILGFLLQAFLYVELLENTNSLILILIGANIAATSIIVWPWAIQPPARLQGVSTSHGRPSRSAARFANTLGLPAGFVLLWIAAGLLPAIVAVSACVFTMLGFSWYCERQIGGHTGDTLGATKKISELGLLLALTIAT